VVSSRLAFRFPDLGGLISETAAARADQARTRYSIRRLDPLDNWYVPLSASLRRA
jgi:hypothetical protein